MSDTPFHCTRMGAQFYDRSVPELIKQLSRLADAVEALVAASNHREASEKVTPGESESSPFETRSD